MSDSINSTKIHHSISGLTETLDEALSPLEAFQETLDNANVHEAECHPVHVATVIESLVAHARQKIEGGIDPC